MQDRPDRERRPGDVISVADDILKTAKAKGKEFTPLQLMKLVYIAYGWHLAMAGERLFDDEIEAWRYGPVIPRLYRATKRFGRDRIPSGLVSDRPLTRDDLADFLESIVDRYGKYDGIALSNLTHRPGTPWHKVYREGELHTNIPDDLIQKHYKAALNVRRSSSSAA